MSKRAELYAVVRDLKAYLQWQQAEGAAGSVAAPGAEREAFAERARQREKQKLARLSEELHEEAPAAEPATAQQQAQQEDAGDQPRKKAPSFDPDAGRSATPDEVPAATEDESTPWKSIGSRPKRKFGASGPPEESMDDEQPPMYSEDRYPEASSGSQGPPASGEPMAATSAEASQAKQDPSQMSKRDKLDYVREYLGDCQRCGLCEHRTNIAFGTGDAEARLVFVGEAPGYNEDQQGEPFVGKAGQLLDKMIGAMGLEREQVYICNVIKCRPPDNRNPHPDEIKECSPFLRKQLEVIEPDVIVTLGKFASQFLTAQEKSMGAMRGRWNDWEGTPVMATYHPAYLLRSPEAKGKTWSDLQMVMERMGLDR